MEGILILSAVVVQCAAAALTSLGCWLVSRRHRKPGWHIALLGTVATTMFISLCDPLLYHPSQWSRYKTSLDAYIQGAAIILVLGLIPALVVVRGYRRKFSQRQQTQ